MNPRSVPKSGSAPFVIGILLSVFCSFVFLASGGSDVAILIGGAMALAGAIMVVIGICRGLDGIHFIAANTQQIQPQVQYPGQPQPPTGEWLQPGPLAFGQEPMIQRRPSHQPPAEGEQPTPGHGRH